MRAHFNSDFCFQGQLHAESLSNILTLPHCLCCCLDFFCLWRPCFKVFILHYFFCFKFWFSGREACGIWAPWPGNPHPLPGRRSLNLRTVRKAPASVYFYDYTFLCCVLPRTPATRQRCIQILGFKFYQPLQYFSRHPMCCYLVSIFLWCLVNCRFADMCVHVCK